MGPGGKGVEDALYIWELGVTMCLKEVCNLSVVKEGILPALHVTSKLFSNVFREWFLCSLYAVFGYGCCAPALPACAAAYSSATFIGCLSHLPISIKYFFQIG